jgi:transposase
MKAHHRFKLTTYKQQFDLFESQITLYLGEMQKLCDEHFSEKISNLTTLPGVSQISAMIIVAETGGDMSAFDNSGKFTGWTGLRPRNDESAGKFKSTATTKGNKHLRTIIVQIAWAASRTKDSFFMNKFTKLAIRKSQHKAKIYITAFFEKIYRGNLYCHFKERLFTLCIILRKVYLILSVNHYLNHRCNLYVEYPTFQEPI